MVVSTMKTVMAAMVVSCALAKPTIQDHSNQNEGYDVLLTPDQFSKLNPGSLHGMAGKCAAQRKEQTMFVNGNLDTIEDCLKWCVNENVVEQRDIGACEYTENDGKPVCTAFKASAFEDSKVTSSENDAGYKCYSLFPDGERRSARGLQNTINNWWPNNELIYDIVDASDPNSWESNGFSQSSAIEHIHLAMTEYHTKTNIRFVKRTTEFHYVSIGYFEGDCSSFVGKVNIGAQRVNLGWCHDDTGSIIHEFGHALGMWHEHNRNDRSTYLNVPSGANFAFDMQNTNSRGIKYDFGSIMHYSLSTFWSDGTGEIVMTLTTEGTSRLSEQGNPTIGQRVGLSQLDIDGLATVYPDLGISRPPSFTAPTRAPTVVPQVSQGSISLGQTKTGDTRFPGVSTIGAENSPDHTYSITIVSTALYVFSTCQGNGFDTLLRLYNSDNTQIAEDDDTCGSQSIIFATLSPGTYLLLVEGISNNGMFPNEGEYTLAMTLVSSSTTTTSTNVASTDSTPAPPTSSPTQAPTSSNPTPSPTPSPSSSNPTPASCPAAAVDQFTHSPKSRDMTPGNRLRTYKGKSLSRCAELCRDTALCFAFSFRSTTGVGKCILLKVPDHSNQQYHQPVSKKAWNYYRMSPDCVAKKLCPNTLARFKESAKSRDTDTTHILLTKKMTVQDCAVKCISFDGCVAFNYKSNVGKCFLLSEGSSSTVWDVWSYFEMPTECRA